MGRIELGFKNKFMPIYFMAPVLKGGRKPVKAKIRRGRKLGGDYEGNVFEAKVTVKRGKEKRSIVLAEKVFKRRGRNSWPNLRRPTAQFKIMSEFRELNKKEKLGLHILPTIRLRDRPFRRATIFSTKYEKVNYNSLSSKQRAALETQRKEEERILGDYGYWIPADVWQIIKDPLTGKPTYYIVDYGTIEKIPKEKK